MSKPTRYGPSIALLRGRLGIADELEPDDDVVDPVDVVASENSGAVQIAVQTEIVEPGDDYNVTLGTVSNDARNSHNFSSPTNANDDDDSTRALRSGFASLGAIFVGLVSDLGSTQLVDSITVHYEINSSAGHPEHVQYSSDGSSWTEAVGTWSGVGVWRTFTLTTPISRRYWAINDDAASGVYLARSIFTWSITGSSTTLSDKEWEPATAVNDADDDTYDTTVSADEVLRIFLLAARVVSRVRMRIATTSAGSKTYELYGTDDPLFGSRTLLATLVFTATGSLSAQDVEASWVATDAWQYYELDGPAVEEEVRFHSFELYGPTAVTAEELEAHITDPTDAHDASAISYANTASGLAATTAQAAIDEVVILGTISPSQLTANTDNWNPTGLATADVIRLSTDASRNITGIVAPAVSRRIVLQNVGSFAAVLVHDATSTAANRFLCPGSANLTLEADDSVEIVYDETSDRWRVLDPAAGGGSIDYGEDADITTLDFDDVADEGVLNEVARADHRHGMPSDPGGGGPGDFSGLAIERRLQAMSDFVAGYDSSAADERGFPLAHLGMSRGHSIFYDECYYRGDASTQGLYNGGLNTNVSGTNSGISDVTGEASHPGILGLAPGTTSSGRARLVQQAVGTVIGSGIVRGGHCLRTPVLSDGTNRYTVRAGFGSLGTGDTDGVYFRYVDNVNGGEWQGVCRSGGVESTVDTNVAGDTSFHWFEYEINAAGNSVQFKIDGTDVGSPVTTNIPTGTGLQWCAASIVKSLGSTNRNLQLDAYYLAQEFTTVR